MKNSWSEMQAGHLVEAVDVLRDEENWNEIKKGNLKALNQSLMNLVAKNQKSQPVMEEEPKVGSLQMLVGSRKSSYQEWQPLDLNLAHYLVNNDPDFVLCIRMYTECANQPLYGPVLRGWKTLQKESEHLAEQLKTLFLVPEMRRVG